MYLSFKEEFNTLQVHFMFLEKTFLLNENGSSIGQITGHFRFVLASPNKDNNKNKKPSYGKPTVKRFSSPDA